MQDFILQKIIFPVTEQSIELYFRSIEFRGNWKKTGIQMKAGEQMDTDTWFNAFFADTWLKYTYLADLYCTLRLTGKFTIEIYTKKLEKDKIHCKLLKMYRKKTQGLEELRIPIPLKAAGMIFIRFVAESDDAIFHAGKYVTRQKEDRQAQINIALDLCTYKREAFIYRTLDQIKTNILKSEESQLAEHLYIVLVDNGKTITGVENTERLIFIQQNDFGSTGGYTRGMLEVLKIKDKCRITNILLMDDDIVFDTEVLERNYAFLYLLKKEYEKCFLGGTMLLMDTPYIQQEQGCYFDGCSLKGAHAKKDLRDVRNLLENHIPQKMNFIGWWYCCMPISVIRRDNLPYPFYMKWDDVEYGCRNKHGFIHLNGIGIWHMAFEKKYSSANVYFQTRNYLIMTTLQKPQGTYQRTARQMIKLMCREVFRYRYTDARLVCRGVEDFLRGPGWLGTQHSDRLYEEIRRQGQKQKKIAPEYLQQFEQKEEIRQFHNEAWTIKKILAFFCAGKKTKKKLLPFDHNRLMEYADAKYVLNYDCVQQKGFLAVEDFGAFVKALFCLLKCLLNLRIHYSQVCKEYQAGRSWFQTDLFWEQYLGMGGRRME